MRPPLQEEALAHIDSLFGYALTLTRSHTEAEDLVQETYLRAIGAAHRLTPDSNIKSWLFTILRNIFLNQVRSRRAGPNHVSSDDETGAPLPLADERTLDPLASLLNDTKRHEIRLAMEGLPPMFREVLVLREFEGLSYAEIAQVLDCPVGTVMSRLGRAREKLRQQLSQWCTEETA